RRRAALQRDPHRRPSHAAGAGQPHRLRSREQQRHGRRRHAERQPRLQRDDRYQHLRGRPDPRLLRFRTGHRDRLRGRYPPAQIGDVPLSNVTLTDDLATQLAQGNPTAFAAVSSSVMGGAGTLNANPAYNGTTATNIFEDGQTLGFSDSELVTETVYVVVTLQPRSATCRSPTSPSPTT